MKTRVIRYSRNHAHHFAYDAESRTWKFCLCDLDDERCTADMTSRPRGFRFDGRSSIDDETAAYIEMASWQYAGDGLYYR